MTILNKLASALNRRDEIPNQELAKQIATKNDTKAIQELIDNLHHKDINIQNDCIKVLYEIGERKPGLIANNIKDFVGILESKNNRLIWGAITALDTIALENPKEIFSSLNKILDASDNGSVIAKDHAVNILIKLCSLKQYSEKAFVLLIEQLNGCPTNQIPMYAENAMTIVNEKNKKLFIKTLSDRIEEVEKESKKKRIEKVIKKLDRL